MQRDLAMNTQGLLMDISAYICIVKHSSNVVAQLTKICRPVGCRPVRLSPSRLLPSWFVAHMTVHRLELESCLFPARCSTDAGGRSVLTP